MAYSDYRALVFRNGKRQPEKEDTSPYNHTEPYYDDFQHTLAFDLSRDSSFDMYHAVLGDQRMRLCGYKSRTHLFFDGRRVDLKEYIVNDEARSSDIKKHYMGEIEGYEFQAILYEDDYEWILSLFLKESNGTYWYTTCTYVG